MGIFAGKISGVNGQITIPAAGGLIGYFANWNLKAEDDGQTYQFMGTLAYINEAAWNAEDMTKQVAVEIGKGKSFILEGATETTLQGRSLIMKGVTLCPAE